MAQRTIGLVGPDPLSLGDILGLGRSCRAKRNGHRHRRHRSKRNGTGLATAHDDPLGDVFFIVYRRVFGFFKDGLRH
jgi:hypothetical protein